MELDAGKCAMEHLGKAINITGDGWAVRGVLVEVRHFLGRDNKVPSTQVRVVVNAGGTTQLLDLTLRDLDKVQIED